jgi:protein-tyrosine phosphatase
MDRGHLRELEYAAPASAKASLCLFLACSGRYKDRDVPDPYYGGDAGFEDVLDMVEEACDRWLDLLQEMRQQREGG